MTALNIIAPDPSENDNHDSSYTNSSEIIFIDGNVSDYQSLIEGAQAGTQVFRLDSSQDGIAQITAALQGGKFSAVHIVSHGNPGSIELGSSTLNAETLETQYAASVQQWRESLTPDADILLYGCNVAQSGSTFLERLAQLTEADVAASDDFTGSAVLGGDWDLEVATGNIESSVVFQPWISTAYRSVLAPNDNFSDRITIAGTNINVTGDNIGATGETGESTRWGTSSVWWSWTAPVSTRFVIDTSGSSYDTTLAIYTGSAVNSLTLLQENDDAIGLASRIAFSATAGTTYQIAVGGFFSNRGSINLNLNAVSLGISNVTLTEGNSGTVDAIFTVNLSTVTPETVTVNYATADGSATTANNDYQNTNGTLTFDPGQTSQTITVPINGDSQFELDETFTLNLSSPVNSGLATSSATATISNDDSMPTIAITPPTITENEGNSGNTAYTYTVNLSRPSGLTTTVTYNTNDGTATVGDGDYTDNDGILTFNPGETSKTITVNVTGDTKFENNENFTVQLNNPTNATLAGTTQTTGNITNNDPVPNVSLSSPTLTQNEGNSGNTAYTYTVNLSNPSYQTVTVNYSTNDGSATVGDGDYTDNDGILTFNPGETSKTITVNVTGDTKFETTENFTVQLNSANNANLSGTTQTASTITNDDLQPTASITPTNITQNEGNSGTTAYTYTVNLSNPSIHTITVGYNTNDQTATVADGDYTNNNGILTFNPGETSKTITVQVNGDTKLETDETFTVQLNNPTNASLSGTTFASSILRNDDQNTPSTDNCFSDNLVRPNIDSIPGLDSSPKPPTVTKLGSEGNDTLIGTDANDQLNGFGGNDWISGLQGDDNILGGTENDTIYGGQGRDWILGEFGNDFINGNQDGDWINSGLGNDTVHGGQGNDFARGGQNEDLMFGDFGDDTLGGDRGNDRIYGGADTGRDLLFGGSGDDFLSGNQGNDTLCGDDGNDTIRAGQNDDIGFGDAGNDLLYGDIGNDSICGDDGNDTIYGGNGGDIPVNNNGEQDWLCGGKGNDLLFGNEGRDNLNGNEGDDTLRGGQDDDILTGGTGNDWLIGDAGADLLRGGSGFDLFILTSGKDTDTVIDFTDGEDVFALSSGLTFQQLNLIDSNGNALIQLKSSGELLAIVSGVQSNLLSQQDFMPVFA